MSSIGGYTVHTLTGPIPSSGAVVDTIERDGVDGVTYRYKGIRPKPYQIRTVTGFTSYTLMQNAKAAYAALEGLYCTVVDSWGTTHTYQMVERVEITEERHVFGTVGTMGVKTYLLFCTWSMRTP